MMPIKPANRRRNDDNPLAECRSLVHLLANKTETLYRECRFDREKAMHIRSMGSALAALTVLVNKLDLDARVAPQIPEIFADGRGIIYESVRSCDLDRICDK